MCLSWKVIQVGLRREVKLETLAPLQARFQAERERHLSAVPTIAQAIQERCSYKADSEIESFVTR